MDNYAARILLAEDEKIIALDLKNTLQRFGYEVTSVVSSGIDVLQKIETEKPDLVILDIMLASKLDGIEAAEIMSYKYDVPVIYLTAYKDETTMARALKTHPYEFLTKPFDEVKLKDAIENALRAHRGQTLPA